MMMQPNDRNAVAHLIETARELVREIDGTSGRGPVTADAVDEQRGSVCEVLAELRERIEGFLG